MSPLETEHFFRTSDRIRLHYKNAGQGERSLVFIPGWLMPAEVFRYQCRDLSQDHQVVVLDPRGQGLSQVPARGMSAQRRARDIHELLQRLELTRYVLIGWSLGVMEVLEALMSHPMPGLQGLVLIDNSIGMASPPAAATRRLRPMGRGPFARYVQEFSRAIFKRAPADDLLHAVERSARLLPPAAAWRLLGQRPPREFYRQAVLSSSVPLWYAITPRYRPQAEELLQTRTGASVSVYEDAGHALFVDRDQDFNADLRRFLSRLP